MILFNLFQIWLVFAIFFTVKFLAWKITEDWKLPQWLKYKPWECYTCLGFWTLITIYLTFGITLELWLGLSIGIALTMLDAVAQLIDKKKKTISIYD